VPEGRRWAPRSRAAAVALLLAAALAGCGGSKSPREQYVAKLNAMCDDFAERAQKIGEPQTPAGLRARGPRLVAAFEQAILEPIESLEAPPGIEDQAVQLRRLARQQAQVLRTLSAAGKQGDIPMLRRLAARYAQLSAQVGEIATDLKASSCASSPG
jgi:hypothetical protein